MNIIEELQSLDTSDPGRWPLPFRVASVILVFIAVLAFGVYMFVVKTEMPLLERAQLAESERTYCT
jgi:type IV pilus assembly protein PilO